MALAVTPCWTTQLLLLLGACLAVAARTDCGKDCVRCAYQLAAPRVDIDALTCLFREEYLVSGDLEARNVNVKFLICAKTCTLGCEGKLLAERSWDLCKDLLQGSMARQSMAGEARDGASHEAGAHALAKKYGGFMKRYGGFMKKTAELYGAEPNGDSEEEAEQQEEEEDRDTEILAKRYGGFMKKDSEGELDGVAILKEVLRAGDNAGGRGDEVSKRYGGFMRSAKRSSSLEDGIKELQKRYGGFMRRVGRPEWKEDQKRYGGFLKRSREEDPDSISEDMPYTDKRYGGFMMY